MVTVCDQLAPWKQDGRGAWWGKSAHLMETREQREREELRTRMHTSWSNPWDASDQAQTSYRPCRSFQGIPVCMAAAGWILLADPGASRGLRGKPGTLLPRSGRADPPFLNGEGTGVRRAAPHAWLCGSYLSCLHLSGTEDFIFSELHSYFGFKSK